LGGRHNSLCNYLVSEELRLEINTGLNVVERWNGINSFIYFGKNGEMATNNLEDQEISVLYPRNFLLKPTDHVN
jgi:TnpA family transposase